MLDVLHLLPVSVGLLQGLDQEGSSRGTDSNLEINVRKYETNTCYINPRIVTVEL